MAGLVGVSTPEIGRYTEFYAHLTGLDKPENTGVVFASSAVISENRNAIMKIAKQGDADWVLFLDDDHVLKPDTLTRLLAADKDVISAHYVQRQFPFNPVLLNELPDGRWMYKQLNNDDQGIIEVGATGAGCLLVRRAALNALEWPQWTLGQIHPSSWGDDLHFCKRLGQKGFKIHCDLDNTIGHYMIGTIEPSRSTGTWVAGFRQHHTMGQLCGWTMPLPGDPVGPA